LHKKQGDVCRICWKLLFLCILTNIARMNNKRKLLIFASLILVLTIVGCKDSRAISVRKVANRKVYPSQKTKTVVIKKEIPLVVDSIGKSYHTKTADLDFAYSFPTSGPRPLIDSIRAYLSSELLSCTAIYSDEKVKTNAYKNTTDGKGMINYYAKATFRKLNSILGEQKDEEVAWTPDIAMFVMKEHETKRYVTYLSSYMSYLGGPHGGGVEYGATFNKKTGKKLKNVLKPHSEKALQPILREGVASYFRDIESHNEKDKAKIEAAVKQEMENLFIENGIIPLPHNTAYLSPKGVVFIYSFYEIGAYVIGTPTFVIPYNKIKNFLTPEARHLAEIE